MAKKQTKKKHAGAMAMVAARMKKLSPERRSEIAKKAADARWKNPKKKPAPAEGGSDEHGRI